MANGQPQDAFAQEVARLKALNPNASDHALNEAALSSLGGAGGQKLAEPSFMQRTFGPREGDIGPSQGGTLSGLYGGMEESGFTPSMVAVPHAVAPGIVSGLSKIGRAIKPDVEGRIGQVLAETFGGSASIPARIATHGERAKALYNVADTASTPLAREPLAKEIFSTVESLGERNKETVVWLQSLAKDLLSESPIYSKVHDMAQSVMNKATSLYNTNPEAASKLSKLRNAFIDIMSETSPVAREAANATRLDKAEEAVLPALRSTNRLKDLSTALHTDTFLRDSLGLTSEGKVADFLDRVSQISKMEDRAKKLKAIAATFTGVGLVGGYIYHRYLYDMLRGH